MCRLFAFSFHKDTKKDIRIDYINAFKKLSVTGSVLIATNPGHGDGWGLSVYRGRTSNPSLYKSVVSAHDDQDFQEDAYLVGDDSESGLIHLRKKTVGEASLLNTHPFVDGQYSFIHNGTICENGDTYSTLSGVCDGGTDSERLFRRFLEIKNKESITVADAYRKMLIETKDLYPMYSAINTILHDGEHVYASRIINMNNAKYGSDTAEKYYTLYVGNSSTGDVVISSEEIPYQTISYSLLPNDSMSILTLSDGSIVTHQLL